MDVTIVKESSKGKLFWVDDEIYVNDGFIRRFENKSFSVLPCEKPQLAEKVYADNVNEIDVVILDYEFEDHAIKGVQIANKIYDINPDAVIIFFSAYLHVKGIVERMESVNPFAIIDKLQGTDYSDDAKKNFKIFEAGVYQNKINTSFQDNYKVPMPIEKFKKIDLSQVPIEEGDIELMLANLNSSYVLPAISRVIPKEDSSNILKEFAIKFGKIINNLEEESSG